MLKNPWFTLILGLLVGIAVGYVLGERQAVPPGNALPVTAGQPSALPPPATGSGAKAAALRKIMNQAAELEGLLANNPNDYRLMVGLANLYYDAEQWVLARTWYERGLAIEADDVDVITDLAVVHRNLGEPETAMKRLHQVTTLDPDHWQAWFNKVIVLHHDLHQYDEALAALERLIELKAVNPAIPDFSDLEQEVRKHVAH